MLLVCMICGQSWVDSLVVMHCDNQAVVSVVNSGYSKDKDKNMMHLMRSLSFVWAYWLFELHGDQMQLMPFHMVMPICSSRCHQMHCHRQAQSHQPLSSY